MNELYGLEGSGVLEGMDVQPAKSASDTFSGVVQKVNLPGWVGRLIFIIVVVLVTLVLVRLINKGFKKMIHQVMRVDSSALIEANTSASLLSFVKYVVLALVYFFAGITIVSSIPGAASTLNTLLASGGIVAVIISFAAKSSLNNIAGGVMILMFKPFTIGDFVRYLDQNVSGTVEEITLRHIVIRTPENKRLIIPNGTITDAIIENANFADSHVCLFYEVGITYESDLTKAMALLQQEAEKNPLTLDMRTPQQLRDGEPKVKVRAIELADSCVKLRAWVWAPNNASSYDIKFALNESVKNRFDAEGIDIAYPHMTILQK